MEDKNNNQVMDMKIEKAVIEFAVAFTTKLEGKISGFYRSDASSRWKNSGFSQDPEQGLDMKLITSGGTRTSNSGFEGEELGDVFLELIPEKVVERRALFVATAVQLFAHYESQFLHIVLREEENEKQVLSVPEGMEERSEGAELGEDLISRIIDYFLELEQPLIPFGSTRRKRPCSQISQELLLRSILHCSEDDGITFNRDWTLGKVLENTGILIPGSKPECDRYFVKKHLCDKEAFKYGFRLKFDFESEYEIFTEFRRVERPTSVNRKFTLSNRSHFDALCTKILTDIASNDTMDHHSTRQKTQSTSPFSQSQILLYSSTPSIAMQAMKSGRGRINNNFFNFKRLPKLKERQDENMKKSSDKVNQQINSLSRKLDDLHCKFSHKGQTGQGADRSKRTREALKPSFSFSVQNGQLILNNAPN